MDEGQELVTCTIEMRFAPEWREPAVRALVSAIGRIEAKHGCRECTVHRSVSDEGQVRYSETWESKLAFRRHLCSDEFGIVLVVMDLCSEEPKVMIGDLSGRSGIGYLAELREEWSANSAEA